MKSFAKYSGLNFLLLLIVILCADAITFAADSNTIESNSISVESQPGQIQIDNDSNSLLQDKSILNSADNSSAIIDKKDAYENDSNAATGNNEVLTTLEKRMQKQISVDFRNTPIEDVLRIIAEQAKIDIVKSPNVTGEVTATLTNVPLEEALDNILAVYGYGYSLTKNMIRVAPIADISRLNTEKLASKVYRITYADVKEVEKALEKFKSPLGSISSNPGTSNIIVTDIESKIRAMDTFIQEIDRETVQILVEARIYDITSKDRLDLGVQWQVGTSTNYGTGGVGGVGVNPTGKTNPFSTGDFQNTVSKASDTTGLFRFGWLNGGIDIDVLIKAQKENIDAKLLANPRILVLDNEKAKIDIVTEIPYQQLNQGGGNTQSYGTTAFRKVGVMLEVIPHLTRDGMIKLDLTPEFSVKTGEINTGDPSGPSYPQPIIDSRKATTKLLIKDGQTVVLGGLRKKEHTKEINKIPLLGDVQLVGWLFRSEGEDNTVSEVVVFVTPRIVEQPVEMSPTESEQLKVTNFAGPKPILTRAEKGN